MTEQSSRHDNFKVFCNDNEKYPDNCRETRQTSYCDQRAIQERVEAKKDTEAKQSSAIFTFHEYVTVA